MHPSSPKSKDSTKVMTIQRPAVRVSVVSDTPPATLGRYLGKLRKIMLMALGTQFLGKWNATSKDSNLL
ncbi:hypothetical protein LguiA_021373 [Lonicera macranthoides]